MVTGCDGLEFDAFPHLQLRHIEWMGGGKNDVILKLLFLPPVVFLWWSTDLASIVPLRNISTTTNIMVLMFILSVPYIKL